MEDLILDEIFVYCYEGLNQVIKPLLDTLIEGSVICSSDGNTFFSDVEELEYLINANLDRNAFQVYLLIVLYIYFIPVRIQQSYLINLFIDDEGILQ
jgi:hypothetical protein